MKEVETDPYDTPEYQAFVSEMAQFCHCKESERPCAGVLAGGMCDGIKDDEERTREMYPEDEDDL